VSALWRVSRAAVRRRRLQTMVIGIVIGLSTTMCVVALGLLAAASGPFDQAYARQRGAHLIAAFDPAMPAAQLQLAARRSGAAAYAGPFGAATVSLTFPRLGPGPETWAVPVAIVGRADPGGAVDRLNLWKGRWVGRPGEIVLNQNPASDLIAFGHQMTGTGDGVIGKQLSAPGGSRLTVVGLAYTVSASAEAWVTPAQLTALHPSASQMLYRFDRVATQAQISAHRTAVAAGLPAGALLDSQSYLALKAEATGEQSTFVPFLIVFGLLGLTVAVLIVANVVSGAVVAGYRHIGVLKALGFTPAQVMGVYLAMVSIPAGIGTVLGALIGNLLAKHLLTSTFETLGTGPIGVSPWVDVVVLLGMPLLVALSALVPALRARRLSAAQAISAGSAPRAGRGLWVQRRLSVSRLPRSVSLGLGLPFARPARSALTLAAVVVGVTSVTLASGLAASVIGYQKLAQRTGAVQLEAVIRDGPPDLPPSARLSDAGDEAMLRSLPGTLRVVPSADLMVRQAGTTQSLQVTFWRGDASRLGFEVLHGHLPNGPGQIVVSERFLRQGAHHLGDTVTLELDGRQSRVQIVGQVLYDSAERAFSNWPTLSLLAPGTRADRYQISLRPGTDRETYTDRIQAGDSGLLTSSPDNSDEFIAEIIATVTVLTLMLSGLAALGVLNTVVLNTRERRRDLGLLKSVGMTPRQVIVMVVTSMAALGAIGGLIGIPIGVVAHRLVLPAMAHASQVAFPERLLNVYHPMVLVLLVLAGIMIASLGAFLPARSAARLTIAQVLRNE
jgi:putative ABC transport system permease protein